MADGSDSERHREGGLGRRSFLVWGGLGATGASVAMTGLAGTEKPKSTEAAEPGGAGALGTVGEISEAERSIFDPTAYLTDWNFAHVGPEERPRYYREEPLGDGKTLREYLFVARDRRIEVAPGVYFAAWTYNDRVPGPTIRATQGDRIRIWFINEGSHPHTIHFHGWHPAEMDGALRHQFVQPAPSAERSFDLSRFGPGEDVRPWEEKDRAELRAHGLDIYEFDADPVGVHLYHCHSIPLKRHIHKGLYGVFVVDPSGEGAPADRRPKIDPDTNEPLPDDHPVQELVMVMNGFDTNFDGENEVYAANTFAFHYMQSPIPTRVGDLVRVYLVNLTEFDFVNSFHLHAGFFRVYRTGTRLRSEEYTDTILMTQAERAILEFRFRWPGKYMFHAHQSEFAELGWMGLFDAKGERVT